MKQRGKEMKKQRKNQIMKQRSKETQTYRHTDKKKLNEKKL